MPQQNYEILYSISDTVDKWIKMLEYNVPNGDLIGGKTLSLTYQHLAAEGFRTEKDMKNVFGLGWCMEMVSLRSTCDSLPQTC